MAEEQKPNETQAATPPVDETPAPVPYERFKEVNDALKTLQAQMAELTKSRAGEEEAKLAEEKKWEELAKKREDELKAERGQHLRLKVATKMGLPQEFADRLRGETEAEMEADAKALAAFLKPREGPGVPPVNGNGRGNKPLDIRNMTPDEIRKHSAELMRARQ